MRVRSCRKSRRVSSYGFINVFLRPASAAPARKAAHRGWRSAEIQRAPCDSRSMVGLRFAVVPQMPGRD